MTSPNPYRWKFDKPARPIAREALLGAVTQRLLRGEAVRVVGGRGTGKSVLLRALGERLAREPNTRVARLVEPPAEPSEAAALAMLAEKFGLSDAAPRSLEALIARAAPGADDRLVVLLDEADAYVQFARLGEVNASFVRAWTNRLETQRKERDGAFGVVIAGGLGLLFLAHELGSALVSRAQTVTMTPFTRAEVRELAAPFAERGTPLSEETLEALYLLSGGLAALVTYGLERLWELPATPVRAVEAIYGGFREEHPDFVRQVWASISRRDTIEAPVRVLQAVRRQAGAVALADLREACSADPVEHQRDPAEALRLLEAAGLIRVEGSVVADPVAAWPIPSIFNLPEPLAHRGNALDDAVAAVVEVLRCMHRFGLDLYRDGALLQEEVFSTFIATGLLLVGWRHVEREALQKGGFVDVKVLVERAALDGHVLVEVKKWSNNDRSKVQQQVFDYRTTGTLGAIVVMIATPEDKVTADKYRMSCLAGVRADPRATPSDLLASWSARPADQGDPFHTVHLIVEVPRRAKKSAATP